MTCVFYFTLKRVYGKITTPQCLDALLIQTEEKKSLYYVSSDAETIKYVVLDCHTRAYLAKGTPRRPTTWEKR